MGSRRNSSRTASLIWSFELVAVWVVLAFFLSVNSPSSLSSVKLEMLQGVGLYAFTHLPTQLVASHNKAASPFVSESSPKLPSTLMEAAYTVLVATVGRMRVARPYSPNARGELKQSVVAPKRREHRWVFMVFFNQGQTVQRGQPARLPKDSLALQETWAGANRSGRGVGGAPERASPSRVSVTGDVRLCTVSQ